MIYLISKFRQVMRTCLLFISLFCGLHTVASDDIEVDTLQDIVVTGTRSATPNRDIPFTVTSISRSMLTQDYQSSIIPAVMQYTPSFFSTSRGIMGYGVSTGSAGTMKFRGVGGGSQMVILIDGQPQYAGLMGHPIPDVYQTFMTEKVEVIRGPASLLYGSNAMGGVVNIITRQMQHSGQHTELNVGGGSYGSVQADAVNKFRKGKFNTITGINYLRSNGHRPNSQFEQTSAFMKIGVDITRNWKSIANINIVHFDASNPGPESAPLIDNDQHVIRGSASISVENTYQKTSGIIRGHFDWGYHRINDGYTASAQPKPYFYKHNDYLSGISWFQTFSIFSHTNFTIGGDWQRFGGRAWNAYNDSATPNAWLTNNSKGGHLLTEDEVGVYFDLRQAITTLFTLETGLRYDWHAQLGSNYIPQGGLSCHITTQDDIKILVSRGFRAPTLRELFMFRSANNQLKAERMMNYEIGYRHQIKNDKGHVGLNLFLIKGKNLINTIYDMTLNRMSNVNTGAFTNHGFEIEGNTLVSKHWKINANYSYLHMKNPIVGAPENKLYLGTTYSNKKFSLHAGLLQIAGLYLSVGDDAEKENYTLVNITSSYQILPQLRFWARIDNLLAQRYQTYLGYSMPKTTIMAGINFNI